MSPKFPEEVDVFTVPHSRMKQLICTYQEKMISLDFSNLTSVEDFLESLSCTFNEFRSHEQIENHYIMNELKQRLQSCADQNTAVCNCHNDNRLTEVLNFVNDGYKWTRKSETERITYRTKLETALQEFTEKFIPHMEEEEEVFQPLLVKYFEYEELKALKDVIIEQHQLFAEKGQLEVGEFEERLAIPLLPDELLTEIFWYLNPRDLVSCAAVCSHWRTAVYVPQLWRELYPVLWARGIWDPHGFDPVTEIEDIASRSTVLSHPCRSEKLPYAGIDEDADLDESGDSSETLCDASVEQRAKKENIFLKRIIKYLIPRIGPWVKKVMLGGCYGLTNSQLKEIARLCPNIEHLDVSYTFLTDSAFKGSGLSYSRLHHLDLTACHHLGDLGLERLSAGLSSSLHYLSISGCYQVTSCGLRHLTSHGLLSQLTHVDLSGCYRIEEDAVRQMSVRSSVLLPEYVWCCNLLQNIESANTCQNIENPVRFCCLTKYDSN